MIWYIMTCILAPRYPITNRSPLSGARSQRARGQSTGREAAVPWFQTWWLNGVLYNMKIQWDINGYKWWFSIYTFIVYNSPSKQEFPYPKICFAMCGMKPHIYIYTYCVYIYTYTYTYIHRMIERGVFQINGGWEYCQVLSDLVWGLSMLMI